MTAITTETATLDQRRPGPPAVDPSRRIDGRRLKSPVAMAALSPSAVGAVGMTLGTFVAGQLAENPTRGLVWLLAICLVGAAVVDTAGKIGWGGWSDAAAGRLGGSRGGPASRGPAPGGPAPAAVRAERAGGGRGPRPDRR